jgi:hypothetical protein
MSAAGGSAALQPARIIGPDAMTHSNNFMIQLCHTSSL